jgi:hypothetical protein
MGARVVGGIEYFDEITMLKAWEGCGDMWPIAQTHPSLVSAARTQFFGGSFLDSL